jgi:GNAT superfamily N-acetyltransferase
MQDLYVDPAFRRRGIGAALVRAVADQGRAQGWARLYWLAEAANPAAQSLYRHIGVRLDFTFHVMPL